MILLIGIKISFTKNPIKPIIRKPMLVAIAIFMNSENKKNIFEISNTLKKHITEDNRHTK
jgi:hypothetical protein